MSTGPQAGRLPSEMSETLTAKERNLSDGVQSYIGSRTAQGGQDGIDGRSALQEVADVDLIDLITQGRKEALEALYGRYSDSVFSLVIHMLRDNGAAEEVTQDAFLNVWRRSASYHADRGSVTSWLFSIAHHRAIDELRRRRRREQTQVNRDVDLASQPSDDTTDPVRYTTQQFRRGVVMDALEVLGPEQREVVVLAYYGGLTHSEIATRLRQPLGTVKTRMRLALKKLRGVLIPQSEKWAEDGL